MWAKAITFIQITSIVILSTASYYFLGLGATLILLFTGIIPLVGTLLGLGLLYLTW